MKTLYLLVLLLFTLWGSSFCQNVSLVVGDTSQLSFHKIYNPFDTIGFGFWHADTAWLDIDNDGGQDFIFISYHIGSEGSGLSYSYIEGLNGNKVMYDTISIHNCMYYTETPEVSVFSFQDTITDSNKSIPGRAYFFYLSWIWENCSTLMQQIFDDYIGVFLNHEGEKGLGWIKIQTQKHGWRSYLILKETGYKSRIYGTKDQIKIPVKIYPNPSNGQINIEVPENVLPANFQVVNTNGQTVIHNTIEKSPLVIDLPPGLYFLLIEKDNIFSKQKILVK